ncbi:hypothetical protein M9Y10_029706 [Tritrichomonas musculus]|uniref:FCP1 homology domain-containing protein n=1 Tax=Tritrichomonas musculus TaxID=1915356 RepID=A0ABR2KMU6_9EUKA
MINEEEKDARSNSRWSIKSIIQKVFFCCPTFFNSDNYYVDLGPIPRCSSTDSSLRKTLVLDLDETLIYSTLSHVDDYDFYIEYKYKNIVFVSRVFKRPGLDEFLNYAQKKFEVVIFTASLRGYADLVINQIAPWVPYSHRFYREDCFYCGSYFIKDLDRLNRPLDSILIVDNSRDSFNFHIPNGILVSSFEGDKEDRELIDYVMPILMKIETSSDVREIIKKLQ